MSLRNLVPLGDGVLRDSLPVVRLEHKEWVVPLLERVFDERDEDSSDGWRMWRGRTFWDGCWSLGVEPVFPSPIKIGLGVEKRENNGETTTLSMLYRPDECKPGINGRNVKVTHDEHA